MATKRDEDGPIEMVTRIWTYNIPNLLTVVEVLANCQLCIRFI